MIFTLERNRLIKSVCIAALVLCSLVETSLHAQLEGSHWYFGNYAGLDFTSGTPIPVFDGALNTSEGCSSVSDKQGNLLFYTDGQNIYDQNHNLMLNGGGLLGHPSSAMSAVICPKPGTWNPSSGRFDGYIVCTIDYEGGTNGVRWSEVDMLGNGGNGEVVLATKNTHLLGVRTIEAANFAVHENGCDYWLITKEVGNAEWRVFPVTAAGVDPNFIASTGGLNTPATFGNIKTSPDSEVVGLINSQAGVNIFDFNRLTGQLSHRYTDNTLGGGYYSLEFSSNGRFVYYTRLNDPNIYQADLESIDQASFINSRVNIGATANTAHNYRVGTLQMGPDGKIYLALPQSGRLGVIEAPNLLGAAANYVDLAIDITGTNVNGLATGLHLGLPSFPSFLFKEPKQIVYTQICNSYDIFLQLSDYNDLYGQEWYVAPIGGDYSTTPNSIDSSLYASGLTPGQYNVKVLLDYNCYSDSVERTVTVNPVDSLDLGADLCYEPGIVLDAGNNFDFYEWHDGSTNTTFSITTPGIYSCEVGKRGDNLIYNGDFEQGNVGFSSQYVYVPSGGGINQGMYTVGTGIPNTWWTGCSDHTSGGGNMMILDADCVTGGSGNAGTNFWCQTVAVLPNTDYYFSVFIANGNNSQNTPEIGLNIDGNLVASHTIAPGACNYEEFSFIWNSGTNETIDLCLNELTGICSGVDFIIDDIGLFPICYMTDTVEVFSLPDADFTIINACANELATMESTATVGSGTFTHYLWDIDTDGTIDYDTSVVEHVYTQNGIYNITHIVEDINGCRDTIAKNIIIYSLPIADFTVDEVCEDTLSSFLNSSTITPIDNDQIVQYEWNFGNNTSSTVENPSISYGSENIYDVQLIVTTNYGCRDTITKNAIVYPLPQVDFSLIEVCLDFATEFTDLSSVSNDYTSNNITNWLWDFADGQTDNSQNPSHTYGAAGNYGVTLTVTTNHGCTAEVDKNVTVFPKPTASFNGTGLMGCTPICPSIVSTSSIDNQYNIVEYEWTINGQSFQENAPSITDCFENEGSNTLYYDVHLKVTSDKGCVSEHTELDYIMVYHNPIADFYYSPESPDVINPEVEFHNTSSYASNYIWSISGGLSSSTDVHPKITFPYEPDSYVVELIAITEHNCRDTITKKIKVEDKIIFYVPNSFTPDHNQYNDTFKPLFTSGFETREYTMYIFNRWGELIFETNDTEVGWDGTYGIEHNGVLGEGTYIWKIDFLETMSDKRHTYSGHVNLLK